MAGYDFGNDASAALAVKGVFQALNEYLSKGEFEDVIAVFPMEIKDFIRGSLAEGSKVF
jgi:uncharacterized protein (DUF2267 family)